MWNVLHKSTTVNSDTLPAAYGVEFGKKIISNSFSFDLFQYHREWIFVVWDSQIPTEHKNRLERNKCAQTTDWIS